MSQSSDPSDVSTESVDPTRHPGRLPERIGRYHVKRAIASGGMGTVYEATQDNPRRVVAVKVMKHGISSKSALRRFEYEGQILGRLRHPGIAQIYEAGTHDDGHGAVPYFAMEYIPNAKTIAKYAEEKKLGTRQRMELFAKVCDAVHHGHQKGIIHRDLKPSNILVDSGGHPKIIDFGVARCTDSDLAVTTLQTDVGQLIGTLQYMSPEQCDADPHDIDTRSDVYALGVVFYELLCGKLPYDVTRMAMHQATRAIREQHPTKLSTINRSLRGDVETIALKALEKERERRYQSAADFGNDLQRYLTGEAVLARRASIVYQLRLFARRNKAVFAALAAVFVVLVGGIIVSTSLYVMADRAHAEQSRERRRAEALNDFLVNDMLASADPEIAQGKDMSVAQVLDEAAARISVAFPDQPELEASIRATIGKTYTRLGLFDKAETQLNAAESLLQTFHGDNHPDTLRIAYDRGELYRYRTTGQTEEREALARKTLAAQQRALGRDHPDTVRTMGQLANVLHNNARARPEARVLYDEALAISKLKLGAGHRTTLKLMNDSALLHYHQGNLDLADKLLRETLAATRRSLGDQHPFCTTNMRILASIASDSGRWADAERWQREAYELSRRVLGEYHPGTLRIMTDFAGIMLSTDRVSESAALAEQALTLSLERLGEGEVATREAMKTLGVVRFRQGHESEAESLLSRSLELTRRADGEKSRRGVGTILALSILRLQQGAMSEVQNLARSVVEALPPEDEWWSTWRQGDDVVFRTPSLALYLQNKDEDASKVAVDYLAWMRGFAEAQKPAPMSLNNYAWALCTCDPPSARNATEAVRMAQRASEAANARDANVLDTLAAAYALNGELSKAVETQRKAVSLLPRRGRPTNLHAHIQLALVSFLLRSGEPVEADASKCELLARLCEGHPASKCGVMQHLGELIVLLFGNEQVYIGESLTGVLTGISSGVFENDKADLVPLPILYALRLESDKQYAASEAILQECLTIRQLMLGESDWRTAQAKSLVGNALLHLDRLDEAGHMLEESLEQMQSAEATPAEELQKARSRLAEYESAIASQR